MLLGKKKSYFKLLNGEQKQGLSAVKKLNQNFVWLVVDFLFIFKDRNSRVAVGICIGLCRCI